MVHARRLSVNPLVSIPAREVNLFLAGFIVRAEHPEPF
jgi:hypothetical protein